MTTLRETLAEHRARTLDRFLGSWLCSCGEVSPPMERGEYVPDTCARNESAHAAHLETVVLAWVGARLAGAREVIAETAWRAAANFGEASDEGPRGYVFDHQAEWVIAALRDALGVPVAPNSAPVDVDPTPTLAAEFDRSNDTDGIPCAACPFLGCDSCEAEATRRANLDAE